MLGVPAFSVNRQRLSRLGRNRDFAVENPCVGRRESEIAFARRDRDRITGPAVLQDGILVVAPAPEAQKPVDERDGVFLRGCAEDGGCAGAARNRTAQ